MKLTRNLKDNNFFGSSFPVVVALNLGADCWHSKWCDRPGTQIRVHELGFRNTVLAYIFPWYKLSSRVPGNMVFCQLSWSYYLAADTSYQASFLQARRKIISILEKLIKEKKASPSSQNRMLDSLLRFDDDTEAKFSDEQIIDLVITMVYSGFETVSTTAMMAIKYLYEHPRALEEIRVRKMSMWL